MEYKTDFLVIGAGIAGLLFALKTAEHGKVCIVTKKNIMESNTSLAQGGIAAVCKSSGDSFDLHIQDTLASGDGLCNPETVEIVVNGGPKHIRELIELGVKFSRKENINPSDNENAFDLGREGGHSKKRIFHSHDMTGLEIERALVQHVKNHNNIEIYENHIAIDLITCSTRLKRGSIITTHEDYCCGAYVLDINRKKVKTFSAGATLLATGGSGKAYLYTSNPDIATGDGIAMGYRAGAAVANLEFVQFHPTCLYHPQAKNFLISEAVRGEGGILLNASGKKFMQKYDKQAELACRDVVARAIDNELKTGGSDSVYLDISHKESSFIKKRFPNLYKKCLTFGIDMTKNPVPVVPAAHYMCGGVLTDIHGRTNINRLYAVGETACTGLHGANRLASNSLLEAAVFANRTAQKAILEIKNINASIPTPPNWNETGTTDSDEVIMVTHNWDEIRRLMWNYVGIVRSDKRLERAQRRIEIIQKEIKEYYWDFKVTSDLIELRNIALTADLIVKCSIFRKESRGLHYNIGYKQRDDKFWRKDTILRRPYIG